jgi:hypothetical protein
LPALILVSKEQPILTTVISLVIKAKPYVSRTLSIAFKYHNVERSERDTEIRGLKVKEITL